jgi:hypothetical protein
VDRDRREELIASARCEISIRQMLPVIFGPLELGIDLSRHRE